MEFLQTLWMPILISGIAVFILSAMVWTVFPHHKSEWRRLSSEDALLDALRAGNVTPGLYSFPFAIDMKEMGNPEFVAKMQRGPVGYLTVAPNGAPAMGPMMAKSVVYNLFVAAMVGYVAFHTIDPNAEYLRVFRVTGTVTFMACALGTVPDAIWFGKPWKSWALQAADAMMYALVTAGIFGWLW